MYGDLQQFWSIDNVEMEERFKREIKATTKSSLNQLKSYLYVLIFAEIIYTTTILNFFEPNLPEVIPNVCKIICCNRIVIRGLVYIFDVPGFLLIFSFDGFFLYNCVYLRTQFEIVGYRMKYVLEKLNRDVERQLIIAIKHHIFLYRWIIILLQRFFFPNCFERGST